MENLSSCFFEMQIVGNRESVNGLISKLKQEVFTFNDSSKNVTFELKKNIPLIEQNVDDIVSIQYSGNYSKSLGPMLKKLTEEFGVIAELYSSSSNPKTQEHVIADRGEYMVNSHKILKSHDISALSESELEDFLEWEDLSKEELMSQVEDGIYYFGGFENFGEMHDLQWYLEQDPRIYFEYTDSFGDSFQVTFAMDFYCAFDTLYLTMGSFDEEQGVLDHYGDVTVMISQLPYLHSAIDTNNNSDKIVEFLETNGFGRDTGKKLLSGFCEYPVFKFNEDKLKQLFPQKYAEYAQLHGIDLSKKKTSLDNQISKAKKKLAPERSQSPCRAEFREN